MLGLPAPSAPWQDLHDLSKIAFPAKASAASDTAAAAQIAISKSNGSFMLVSPLVDAPPWRRYFVARPKVFKTSGEDSSTAMTL